MVFQLESVVCGHHVYKSVCKPRIGEVLPGYKEHNNRDAVYLKKRLGNCQARTKKIFKDCGYV